MVAATTLHHCERKRTSRLQQHADLEEEKKEKKPFFPTSGGSGGIGDPQPIARRRTIDDRRRTIDGTIDDPSDHFTEGLLIILEELIFF